MKLPQEDDAGVGEEMTQPEWESLEKIDWENLFANIKFQNSIVKEVER